MKSIIKVLVAVVLTMSMAVPNSNAQNPPHKAWQTAIFAAG